MPGYYIDMIDVGEGDAFIIASYDLKAVCLVDAGSANAGNVVTEHIYQCYDGKISTAILTHIDDDHIGGMEALLDNGILPQTVIINNPMMAVNKLLVEDKEKRLILSSVRQARTLIDRLRDERIVLQSGFANARIKITDNLIMKILSPTKDEFMNYVTKYKKTNIAQLIEKRAAKLKSRVCTSENKSSIVFELRYDDGYENDTALFTGDASLDVLRKVANKEYDWVKIPHHGSWHNCSKELIQKWNPKQAALSYGVGNKSNHPCNEVLEWLRENGTEVLCTVCHGTVRSTRAGATAPKGWAETYEECMCGTEQ